MIPEIWIELCDQTDPEKGWYHIPFIDIEFSYDTPWFSLLLREISFEESQNLINELQKGLDDAKGLFQSLATTARIEQ